MNKNILITVLVGVLAAGGGFFGGMKYQSMQRQNRAGNFQAGRGQRAGAGFMPVSGEIVSVDDKSITVKLMDGGSKIVLLTDTTSISKSDQATKADLKVGMKVAAFGSQNSDGSVTAQSIQLNPMFRNMPSPSGQK